MSVVIRLKKFGTIRKPYFRIVVMDSRAPRDGKTLDELGIYHPKEREERQVFFDEAKARVWLDKGALPSDTVRTLFNRKNLYLKS